MAVLWRSMESAGEPDEGYQVDTAVLTGAMRDRNTFFEKHVRISNPLPSDTNMKLEVKRVWADRQKRPHTKVQGGRGIRTKADVYGKLTPSASGILFATTAGFLEINAWIEQFVTRSGGKCRVPILGGSVVVSWSVDTFTYDVINSGYLVLGIRVGNQTSVELGTSPYAIDNDITGTLQSKVVYHMEPTVRGA